MAVERHTQSPQTQVHGEWKQPTVTPRPGRREPQTKQSQKEEEVQDTFSSRLNKDTGWGSVNHQATGTINPELCDSALEISSFPRRGSLACLGRLNPRHQASQPGKDSRSQNYLR